MIKKVSSKHAKTLRKYKKVRKEVLEAHPLCKIDLPGCTRKATEIEHSAKKYSEELWLDKTKMIPACRHCHDKVHNSPNLAREMGIYNYKI